MNYLKIKKPEVSQAVATFIEATRDDRLLDILFEVELYYSANEDVAVSQRKEIADYFNNCFNEFVIAREYGYVVT